MDFCRDAHIDAMCGWSMSLTGFGVAKLRAAVKAMLKQYDGASIARGYSMSHYKACQAAPGKQTAILLAIRQMSRYIQSISSRAPGCYR